MAANFDSAASAWRVNHGSGAGLDNLHAAAFTAGPFHLVRTSNGANQLIYSKDGSGTAGHIGFVSNAGGEGQLNFNVRRSVATSTAVSAAGTVPLNVDIWVIFQYDPSDVQPCRMFFAGRAGPPAEVAYSGTPAVGSGTRVDDAAYDLMIGNASSATAGGAPIANLPFRGNVTRAQFFNRKLTLGEMGFLMAQAAGAVAAMNISGTVLLAEYDNGSSAIDASDRSGNGNTGTVTGATWTANGNMVTKTPVTSSNLMWSPYNTDTDGSGLQANNVKGGATYAQWNTPGGYLRFRYNIPSSPGIGSVVGIELDVSNLSTISSAALAPVVAYSLNGGAAVGAFTRVQLAKTPSGKSILWIDYNRNVGGVSTNIDVELHFAAVGFTSGSSTDDRWTTPVLSVRITGVVCFSVTAVTTIPTARPNNLLLYGDSAFEGRNNLATGSGEASHEHQRTVGRILGRVLNAEYGLIAYSGAGFTRGIGLATASSTNPSFYSTTSANRFVDQYMNGRSRLVSGLLSPVPKWILVGLGWNDASLTATQVKDSLEYLQSLSPTSLIGVLIDYPVGAVTAVSDGIALMANQTRIRRIDATALFTLGQVTEYTFDGLHPDYIAHPVLAADIAHQLTVRGSRAREVNA